MSTNNLKLLTELSALNKDRTTNKLKTYKLEISKNKKMISIQGKNRTIYRKF